MFRSRCSKSQCFTVSVPNYAEGCSSAATQNELNHFFVLSIVTNSNLSSFYSPVELFPPDKMWLQWPRGYQFFIRFVEAVGVSECLGCSGLLGFLLGCSGLPRLSLFEGKLLRLMA